MSWYGNGDRRDACMMDACYPRPLDSCIWQELPPVLIALIISKLPIVKLIEVVQQCGRFIKNQVIDAPPELLRQHRSAECLFPIFNTPDSGWMSSFGVKYQNWSPMPDLNFLPRNVKHVLTGAGGLLCVTSSQNQQYRAEKCLTPRELVPDWMSYPAQPVIAICNPLTRETRVLPPMPGALKFPVAHMKTCKCTGNYALYLAGWDERADAMVVTVFTSKAKAWLGWRSLPNGLRPTSTRYPGAVSCAVLTNEMWLPGEVRWAGFWEPRILCFDFNRQTWKYVLHWLPNCEPPHVVEAEGSLYAVTRRSEKPFSLHILEVTGTCENTCPYSNFKEIAQMPQNVYCHFFEMDVRKSRPCHVKWESRAGKGFIYFYNLISGCVAWYHLRAAMKGRDKCWGLTKDREPNFESGYTSMVSCMWQPSFAASV